MLASTAVQGQIKLISINQRSSADLERFARVTNSAPIRALYAPYKDVWCPYTESTLIKTLAVQNPIWEHTQCQLFIAERDGTDVGRVMAHLNPESNLFKEEGYGFFGFLEAADEETARTLLFDGAWPWAKARGAKGIVGNNNPTNNDEVGVLIEGFNQHVILLEFNPPEYPRWLEKFGFTKAKDVLAFNAPLTAEVFKPIVGPRFTVKAFQHVAKLLAARSHVTLETLDKRRAAEFARDFCSVYNQAWRDHWGFEPFSSAEMLYLSKELISIIPKDLVVIARDPHGKMVGVGIATPDFNEVFRHFDGRFGIMEQIKTVLALFAPKVLSPLPQPTTMRVVALGVLPEYARGGASGALMCKLCGYAIKKGYKNVNISWVLEDNEPMMAMPRRVGLKPDQRWRMFAWRPELTS